MSPVASRSDEADLALREQLSSLQALVALSMRMTDSDDEALILRLAGTAVPSLASCRLVGIHLTEEGWRAAPDDAVEAQLLADVETQLAIVTRAGGAISVGHEAWGWAFPLRSISGHFGFLIVSADAEPLPGAQFLLRVLSQQTGVALANARLHTHERRQAAELLAINSQLADTLTALERSTAVHDRLTQVAVAGEGQEGIARAVHEVTGFAVAIEDRYGNLRAWAGPDPAPPIPKDPPDAREAMLRRALEASGPIRHDGRLLVVAQPREDILGVLALVDPDEIAGEQAKVALEHAATVLAMELARLSSITEAEIHLRRDLVDELLAGTDETSAIARAEALGYDLERPHRAIVVEAPDLSDRRELFHAVRRAARGCGVGTLLIKRGQSIVVLADTDRPWDTFRTAVSNELHGGRCRVGVGSVCERVGDLPRSHREALFALRVQAEAGGSAQATSFDELGVYRLLSGLDDLDDIERFASSWLGDLIDYDAKKEASELVTTLGEYLDRGGSYDATAQALSVHRSTLKYRLQRIREISGHDLSSPETQFNLQLALRAWRTLCILRGERPN
jgi:DNA-binding PucR family transcriptional regulator